jgi:hypothetical protein
MSMLLRVVVLSLGLLGGFSSGIIGIKWLAGGFSNADVVEAKRAQADQGQQTYVERFDNCRKAAWALLLAAPLGILGGLLAGMGRGKLAAIPLLLAVPAPVILSGWSMVPISCLFWAGVFALFIGRPRNHSERGIKGCFNAIKGWFNIGGVKVKFKNVADNVSWSGNQVRGSVELSAKSDRYVAGVHFKFVQKRTVKEDGKKKTKENVLGETSQALNLDMHAGENRTVDFQLPYSASKSLKDKGGLLGGVGKLAAFATGETDEYLLIAEADVDGALVEPTDNKKVTMVD